MRLSGKEEIRMQKEIMIEWNFSGAGEHISQTISTSAGTTCSLQIIAGAWWAVGQENGCNAADINSQFHGRT
ncbi:hypothetical protein SDC9_178121 [bioreactor metagenome]|uniref:Uncharacterized protein n=1 Tax=bioreactor metagenome TaxID=1076179 RepID=A0A645GWC2_9ZZZZ